MNRSIAFALTLSVALTLLPGCRTTRAFDSRRSAVPVPLADGAVEIPYTDAAGILLLPALIDGKGPFAFAMDTGATTVVVGTAAVADAGLRTEERQATIVTELGERLRTVEQTQFRELRLGGVKMQRVGALVADLSDLSRSIGSPLDGIVGVSVLRHHVWTVDTLRRVVTVSDEAVPEPDGVNVLALDMSAELPELEIEIAGRRIKATLDTGQRAALSLSADDARPLRGLMEVVGTSTGQVLDGRVERELARLSVDVRAGALVLEQPVVILATGTRIGLAAFEGRRFTLDLAKGRLWLRTSVDTVSPANAPRDAR